MTDELAEQRGGVATQVDATTSVSSGPARPAYRPNPVLTASGKNGGIAAATVQLQHFREAAFYEEARDKYLSQNAFTQASDIQALDRLLLMETQMMRWQYFVAGGMDYDLVDLEASEERDIQRSMKETAAMISQLQNDLQLTVAARARARETGSVAAYIEQLRAKAKEHGYFRDKQLGKAIELMKEVMALAGTFNRSDENERRKLGFESSQDVVDYIDEVIRPQFEAVDEHYRQTNQRFWIREI